MTPHSSAENQEFRDGQWVAAVPLPFFGLFHIACSCQKRFWGFYRGIGTGSRVCARYEAHYRAEHAQLTQSDAEE